MSFVEFTGTARLDKRTKRLVRRLGPDDIAIIDHRDLDRVSAEELLATNVRVVLNVSPSMSGRFPNAGPLELVRGGVRLIDVNGDSDLFEEVRDGESLVVRGSSLFRNGSRLAAGHMLTELELETELAEQRGRVTEALENFAENTLRYLRDEAKLLSEGVRLPAGADSLPRPPRARRRPRPRDEARPADRQALHPGLQAGSRGRGRRR